MMDYKNKWALITGASAGLGAAYAKRFAELGVNLILVARREDRLTVLADELRRKHAIEIDVLPMDLNKPFASEDIFQAVNQKERKVDILINNAGLGAFGHFDASDRERNQQQITVNILALTSLTHLFLTSMVKEKQGIIINLASIAGFNPLAYFAVYAATKAYVLSFTEALWAEYQGSGIQFLAVCPGPVETEFFTAAKMTDASISEKDTPENVAEKTLEALEKNQPSIIVASTKNVFLTKLSRLLPRSMVAKMAAQMMKPTS